MRNQFQENGGKYIHSLHHEDTYFNMPGELRNFRKTDEALRVRKSTTYDRMDPENKEDTHYYITYKGKKIDTTTKSRNELETDIKNGEVMKEILKLLGFREIFTVKKERELYEFEVDGKILEALIDYIPILNEHFIEVELKAEMEREMEQARNLLFKFLNHFGIKEEQSIRKSYLELIAERLRKGTEEISLDRSGI